MESPNAFSNQQANPAAPASQPARPNPLAPGKLDQQLQQQVSNMYSDAQKTQQAQTEQEKMKQAVEEAQKFRSFGFVTAKDMEESFSKKDAQINQLSKLLDSAFAELQQIREAIRFGITPGQNSGRLDDRPREKNPLELWGNYEEQLRILDQQRRR